MKELQQQHYDDGRAPEPIYDDRPRTVSLAEQKQTGMVRPSNYVPAEITAVAKRGPAQVLPLQDTSHTLDIPLQSTQHIEMKTSAVDRAKGYLIATLPLLAAFALGIWLLSGLLTATPLFSFLGLCILWSSFVLAWLLSYWYTLHVSAEGVSMFEARSKWKIIAREQDRRWAHYDKLTGGDE